MDSHSPGLGPSCLHPAVCPQASHVTTLNLSLVLWNLVTIPICRVAGKSKCADSGVRIHSRCSVNIKCSPSLKKEKLA